MARATGDGRISQRTAVHEKDVKPTIVVEVEEEATRADNLGEEPLLARAADVDEVNPC